MRDHMRQTEKDTIDVVTFLKKQDTDGDGLVDNGEYADQTYDAWTVTGARYLNYMMILNIFLII